MAAERMGNTRNLVTMNKMWYKVVYNGILQNKKHNTKQNTTNTCIPLWIQATPSAMGACERSAWRLISSGPANKESFDESGKPSIVAAVS